MMRSVGCSEGGFGCACVGQACTHAMSVLCPCDMGKHREDMCNPHSVTAVFSNALSTHALRPLDLLPRGACILLCTLTLLSSSYTSVLSINLAASLSFTDNPTLQLLRSSG